MHRRSGQRNPKQQTWLAEPKIIEELSTKDLEFFKASVYPVLWGKSIYQQKPNKCSSKSFAAKFFIFFSITSFNAVVINSLLFDYKMLIDVSIQAFQAKRKNKAILSFLFFSESTLFTNPEDVSATLSFVFTSPVVCVKITVFATTDQPAVDTSMWEDNVYIHGQKNGYPRILVIFYGASLIREIKVISLVDWTIFGNSPHVNLFSPFFGGKRPAQTSH